MAAISRVSGVMSTYNGSNFGNGRNKYKYKNFPYTARELFENYNQAFFNTFPCLKNLTFQEMLEYFANKPSEQDVLMRLAKKYNLYKESIKFPPTYRLRIYEDILNEMQLNEEDCGTVCANQCSSTGFSAFAPQHVVTVNSKDEEEDKDKLI